MANQLQFRQPSIQKAQHSFSTVPKAEIPRSRFNRSHSVKTTFDAGYLIPIFCDEVLPGDTHHCEPTLFARMNTPLHPLMDNLYLDTFYFFVPSRLLWSNWEKFVGSRDNPEDSIDYTVPVAATKGGTVFTGSILDYFGLPLGLLDENVNALPLRAYNLIWNEWFRDQNLQDSVTVPTGDGPDTPMLYQLLRRGKRHDYFTSCLPWPQKGPDVLLPLGQVAPILADGDGWSTGHGSVQVTHARRLGVQDLGALQVAGSTTVSVTNPPSAAGNITLDGTLSVSGTSVEALAEHFMADLTGATSASINDIREAFQVQRFLERDARSGTRYVELLLSHFGVQSPDFRLQRPEYIGGGSTMVNIQPIAATVPSSLAPQGNLAGVGTVVHRDGGFDYSAVEHGYIIGLAAVRADLTYSQGLLRMWTRQTRYDFYWPVFAHLGEQPVLNKEIFYDATDGKNDDVFGYQERYAEYRYKPSQLTGLMRPSSGYLGEVWTASQFFDERPTLSAEFIEDNPPIDRIVAVSSEPQFLLDAWFQLYSTRPMPVYSVPGLVDHF